MTADTAPCTPSASEERAAMVEFHRRELELASMQADRPGISPTERASYNGIAAAHRASLAILTTGEHVRREAPPTTRPRDLREIQERLAAEWTSIWMAVDPDTRNGVHGPIVAVDIAGQVAARYVESLDARGLDKFHEIVGMPPVWSRAHAVGSLAGFLFMLYGAIAVGQVKEAG